MEGKKENNTTILSLCIPTYNRAAILEETLESIVNNPYFNEEVEVVISDNASTDNTEEIGRKYADKFKNVYYSRNKENIKMNNFWHVLTLGKGEYLMLLNDWGKIGPNTLEYMLRNIKSNINDQQNTNIYFTGNYLYTSVSKNKEYIECNSLAEYMAAVSTYTTAIFVFGIWKSKMKNIEEPQKYSYCELGQVDWSYQLQRNCKAKIYNRGIHARHPRMRKEVRRGYNWFYIHVDRYYAIIQSYCDQGLVSSAMLLRDKKNMLRHFKREMVYCFYKRPPLWQYGNEKAFHYLYKHCKSIPLFWGLIISSPFRYLNWQTHDLAQKYLSPKTFDFLKSLKWKLKGVKI